MCDYAVNIVLTILPQSPVPTACLISFVAGVFCITSVTVFAGAFRGNHTMLPFGYAFWVAVLSGVFFVANSLVMFAISLAVNRNREERKQMAQLAPMA